MSVNPGEIFMVFVFVTEYIAVFTEGTSRYKKGIE
jgi:hypothetical protein